MLNHPIRRLLDSAFLRISGGDAIRADELRARCTSSFLSFIMASYVPLLLAVALLVVNRPQPVNEDIARDQIIAVEDFAMRYVNTYLKDPSNASAIKQFYDGEIPASRCLQAEACCGLDRLSPAQSPTVSRHIQCLSPLGFPRLPTRRPWWRCGCRPTSPRT